MLDNLTFFATLTDDEQLIVLEAAWQALRHELPTTAWVEPVDLDLSNEAMQPIYDKLHNHLNGDELETVSEERYLRSRGEE